MARALLPTWRGPHSEDSAALRSGVRSGRTSPVFLRKRTFLPSTTLQAGQKRAQQRPSARGVAGTVDSACAAAGQPRHVAGCKNSPIARATADQRDSAGLLPARTAAGLCMPEGADLRTVALSQARPAGATIRAQPGLLDDSLVAHAAVDLLRGAVHGHVGVVHRELLLHNLAGLPLRARLHVLGLQ